VPSWYVAQIDFWIGDLQVDLGDIAAGLTLMETSAPELSRALVSTRDKTQLTRTLGWALMYAGKHESADHWLREGLRITVAAGRGTHPYTAGSYMSVAKNLVMMGKLNDAEKVLDEAPIFPAIRDEGTGAGNRYNDMLTHQRADVLLARGDASGSLSLLLAHAPNPDADKIDHAGYRKQLGEALCAAGRHREGLATLEQGVEEWFRAFPEMVESDPLQAMERAIAGQCALKLGDRRKAAGYATLARAAFTAQPEVSPYYKAPLIKLEAALGIKPARVTTSQGDRSPNRSAATSSSR